jgi:hypothetical protein
MLDGLHARIAARNVSLHDNHRQTMDQMVVVDIAKFELAQVDQQLLSARCCTAESFRQHSARTTILSSTVAM